VVVGTHAYERFDSQRPVGTRGGERDIRQFVVGTGGGTRHGFGKVRPNSQALNATTPGVLRLTLEPGSYSWEVLPVAGKTFTDSGATGCH